MLVLVKLRYMLIEQMSVTGKIYINHCFPGLQLVNIGKHVTSAPVLVTCFSNIDHLFSGNQQSYLLVLAMLASVKLRYMLMEHISLTVKFYINSWLLVYRWSILVKTGYQYPSTSNLFFQY